MKNFWNREAKEVARDLIGKELVIGGNLRTTVLKAQGFAGKDNSKGIYKPIMDMDPGQVYCPQHRNAVLLLIVTKDHGCVLIKAAAVEENICDGPGKVTDWFQIESRSTGYVEQENGDLFAVHITGQPKPKPMPWRKAPKPKSPKGISKAVLAKLMPKIAEKYLQEKPAGTFHDFFNGLLETCKSEEELKKALK